MRTNEPRMFACSGDDVVSVTRRKARSENSVRSMRRGRWIAGSQSRQRRDGGDTETGYRNHSSHDGLEGHCPARRVWTSPLESRSFGSFSYGYSVDKVLHTSSNVCSSKIALSDGTQRRSILVTQFGIFSLRSLKRISKIREDCDEVLRHYFNRLGWLPRFETRALNVQSPRPVENIRQHFESPGKALYGRR